MNLYYNGVCLHNILIREWRQEDQYDDSHTDIICHRHRISVEGSIHLQGLVPTIRAPVYTIQVATNGTMTITPSGAVPNTTVTPWASMDAALEAIRSQLSVTRRELIISVTNPGESTCGANQDGEADTTVGTTTETAWFLCGPSPQYGSMKYVDVDNGPKPAGFDVLRIVKNKTIRVVFTIECARVDCLTSSGQAFPSLVLSNRWSVEEDTDAASFVTRTVQGTLRLSSAMNWISLTSTPENWMWWIKGIVVPQLEVNFRRESVRFAVDPTGLVCRYTVVDRQVHTAAPWPALKMDGSFSFGTSDGLTPVAEVRVRLEGAANSDKRLLISRIVDIFDAKLRFRRKKSDWKTAFWPENISIVESMGEQNTVEGILRIRYTPGITPSNGQTALGAFLGTFMHDQMGQPLSLPPFPGEPQSYDPQVSIQPALYGYQCFRDERRPAAMLALSCYVQNPCVSLHSMPPILAYSTPLPSKNPPPETSSTPSPGDLANSDSGQSALFSLPPETVGQTSPSGGSIASPDASPDDPTIWEDDYIDELEEYSEDAKENLYNFARVESTYERDEIRVRLPIAGTQATSTAATSVTIRLAPAMVKRTIRFDAERVGDWPHSPKLLDTYTDGSLTGTLLRGEITPIAPTFSPVTGEKMYRCSGWAEYAMNRAPNADEKLSVGVLPITNFTVAETKYDPASQVVLLGPGDSA